MSLHYRLSFVLPLPFTSEFVSHVGVPYRVSWWQWRGRIWRKGGSPTGPRIPALASPCRCHDAEGRRSAPDPTVHRGTP